MRLPVFFAIAVLCSSASAAEVEPGSYAAELQTPGGAIRFSLVLEKDADVWSAKIVDPLEPLDIPVVLVEDNHVKLAFPHYDSSIKAKFEDGRLSGTYKRRRGKEQFAEMAFAARRGEVKKWEAADFGDFAGRWAVNFSKSDDPAIGLFATRKSDQQNWGTFLTTTGDYRFLTQQPCDKPDHVELSVFDGAHAFLFRMKKDGEDAVVGDFWSSDSWHEPFAAKRDSSARLPDAFRLTTVLKGVNLNDIRYPDLDGKLTSLGDDRFAGKAKIIQVFGSWCPNCHDAALYMSELQKKYGDQGLSIVGLAFEHTGDFERDVEMVRRYMKRHGTQYPVLLAGLSDKSKATKQFPLIDRVRSYPTTIFVRSDGSVRAVYTGFNGPATGEANKKLRARFEGLIEELLKSSN